jgi:catechol 2,3-dioxygenase-like lactoylglutathione lyase family enzyme
MNAITAVRSVEYDTPDLERSATFYERIWGMSVVAREPRAVYLRAGGADHHAVVLRSGLTAGLALVGLTARDEASVDALAIRIAGAGGTVHGEPARRTEPGGGYGFRFTDPEGRMFEVLAGMDGHDETAHANDRPTKISHVVLNASDADRTTSFLRDALGFRLRDQTKMMDFLGCNADHHSIAVTRIGNTSLNHVAFEVADIDGVMRASGRLKQHGFGIEWGVGRHGPGGNVFSYFIDPNDLAIEYTAEIEQVDDATYAVGTPETWARGNNLDAWGLAEPPTRRFDIVTHFADAVAS